MIFDKVLRDVPQTVQRILEGLDHRLTARDNFGPEGEAGWVLTSNGPNQIPSYQPNTGGGGSDECNCDLENLDASWIKSGTLPVGRLQGQYGGLVVPWYQITETPTTLAGYGILDAYTMAEVDALLALYYTAAELDAGQLDNRYYTETEIDAFLALYYTKVQLDGGQLDNRYYTETELDAGQLDNRYYTETELDAGQLDNRYYTETEADALFAPIVHNHDTRYYTETELDAGQLDNRYYTETEVDALLAALETHDLADWPADAAGVLTNDGAGNYSWVAGGGGSVDGSGTAGKLPKWADSDTLTDSLLSEAGTVITCAADLVFTADDTWDIGAVGNNRPANIIYSNALIGHNALLQDRSSTAPSIQMTHGLLTGIIDWPSADSFRIGISASSRIVFDDGDGTAAITGHTIPSADDTYDLGTSVSASRWRSLFLSDRWTIGNPGSGTAILSKIDGGAGAVPDIEFYTGGAIKAIIGVAAAADDILTGTVAGDLVFRTPGGDFQFTRDNGSSYLLKLIDNVMLFNGPGFELGDQDTPQHTYIDFHSEGNTDDYDMRIIRLSGINGAGGIEQTGSGGFTITPGSGGLTIDQQDFDNHFFKCKSSDVAHGMTSFDGTDVFFYMEENATNLGGIKMTALSEAVRVFDILAKTPTATTTKSVGADAPLCLDAALKSGTGSTNMSANSNLLMIRNNGAAKFIFDADGDSHQDIGTAWTNFDTHDDVALLNLLSAHITRQDDPLRGSFSKWLEESRDELERIKLVVFNEDGHHFVNMSRLTMLLTGAVRQIGERLAVMERLMLNAQN